MVAGVVMARSSASARPAAARARTAPARSASARSFSGSVLQSAPSTRVDADVVTREAWIAVEHHDAASHGRDRDAGSARDHPIPAADHSEAQALATVEHGARPEALLRELPPDDESAVPVVRRLVRHAQRSGGETPQHVAAKVDHDDTFTALDGQRARRRLRRRGERGDRGGAERAQEEDQLQHGSALVSAHRM